MSFTDPDGRSCFDCPSYLGTEEASSFFGITAVTPMCARFGYLMNKPTLGTTETLGSAEVMEHWAGKCPEYGRARPTTRSLSPHGFKPLLFMPDTKVLDKPVNDTTVLTCTDCANQAYDSVTGQRACKALGVVLFAGTEVNLASGCAWRNKRTSSITPASAIEMMPPYGVAVTVRRKPVKKALFTSIDPTAYHSDAPVADEHKGMIRAWRSVIIEDSGNQHFLPIFETDYFSEEDQQLIPKRGASDGDPSLYVDHSGLLEAFTVVSYKRDCSLTLIGEPGSGKTEGARWLAGELNMPFMPLNYNEFSEPEHFLGQMAFKGGETLVAPGLLPLWWEKPCLLLSDEWNLPQEGIQQIYRSMNDASRILRVYDRTFKRHDYCFHLLAMNPAWDFRNIGAKELASADVRRLSPHYMPLPDEATSKAIINEALKRLDDESLPTAKITAIMKIAKDLREMAKQGKIPHHWTLSQDLKVARFAIDFRLETAYRLAYFNLIDPDIAEVAMSLIKSMIPAGL